MKLFNVGALRPATDGARLSAAHDLVQRTLARHGLASPVEPGQPPVSPGLSDLLTRQSGGGGGPVQPDAAVPAGATFHDEVFSCNAGARRYRTYVPASATHGATGVVMMLHGCTQSPEDFAAGTGMNALADRHGFVVVYPGQSRGDNPHSC